METEQVVQDTFHEKKNIKQEAYTDDLLLII